jgi:hypothetical protein
MNRLNTLLSQDFCKLRSMLFLKSNRITKDFSFHFRFATSVATELPQHEFLTAQRILPNTILVPIMRSIYSTNNINELNPLIAKFSYYFKRSHYNLILFWCGTNYKDLVNRSLLDNKHILILKRSVLIKKLRFVSSIIFIT